MRPLSADTPLEVERIWIEAQRRLGPAGRLLRAVEMTEMCWQAGAAAVRRAHPEASPEEQDRLLLGQRYGDHLATAVIRLRIEKGFYD